MHETPTHFSSFDGIFVFDKHLKLKFMPHIYSLDKTISWQKLHGFFPFFSHLPLSLTLFQCSMEQMFFTIFLFTSLILARCVCFVVVVVVRFVFILGWHICVCHFRCTHIIQAPTNSISRFEFYVSRMQPIITIIMICRMFFKSLRLKNHGIYKSFCETYTQ